MSKNLAEAVERLMESAAVRLKTSSLSGGCGCPLIPAPKDDDWYFNNEVKECEHPDNWIPREDATGDMLEVHIGEMNGDPEIYDNPEDVRSNQGWRNYDFNREEEEPFILADVNEEMFGDLDV